MTARLGGPATGGRLERDTLQLTITLLEKRAKIGPRVEISDQLALVIARQLRRLLDQER